MCYDVGVGLWFDEEANAALDRLGNDPARERLAAAVNRVLDQLEDDPGDRSVRRSRFHVPALWCVTVFADDEEWAVLWEPHPDISGDVIVQFIGPATFR
jgi:hypothetical protein